METRAGQRDAHETTCASWKNQTLCTCVQPASAPALGTALRHPAMAAITLQEAFLFRAAWVSCFFRASSLFLSSTFKFLVREQLQTGVENSASLAASRLSCGPLETVVLKGDIIQWWIRHGLGAEGLTSSLWDFLRSHSAFQGLLDAVSWAGSPCCAHWILCQMWSKPSEDTGDVCRRAYILHVFSWSTFLSLLPL